MLRKKEANKPKIPYPPSKSPDIVISRQRKAIENPESTGGSFSKEPDIIRIYGNIIKDTRPKPVTRMRIYAKSQSPQPPQDARPSTSLGNKIPRQPAIEKPINEYRNLRKTYLESRRYRIANREKNSNNIDQQFLNSLNFSYQSNSPRLGTAGIGVTRKRLGTSDYSHRF